MTWQKLQQETMSQPSQGLLQPVDNYCKYEIIHGFNFEIFFLLFSFTDKSICGLAFPDFVSYLLLLPFSSPIKTSRIFRWRLVTNISGNKKEISIFVFHLSTYQIHITYIYIHSIHTCTYIITSTHTNKKTHEVHSGYNHDTKPDKLAV